MVAAHISPGRGSRPDQEQRLFGLLGQAADEVHVTDDDRTDRGLSHGYHDLLAKCWLIHA